MIGIKAKDDHIIFLILVEWLKVELFMIEL